MKVEHQDRIEDYLLNRMTDDDRLAFEQELEKDAELRDQYEFTSMVKTALMLENIENDVSDWNSAHIERAETALAAQGAAYKATGSGYDYSAAPEYGDNVAPCSSNRHVIYLISGMAAVFIVGFFLFNTYRVATSEPDMCPMPTNESAYAPRPQGASSVRGADAITENLLAQGDYKGALERIEALEGEIVAEMYELERKKESNEVCCRPSYKGTPKENKDRMIRGKQQEEDLTTKLEQEKKEKEIEERRKLQEREMEMDQKQVILMFKQEELSWLKVQALIGLDRMEEAISLLYTIRQSESEFKVQADSLYNSLRK